MVYTGLRGPGSTGPALPGGGTWLPVWTGHELQGSPRCPPLLGPSQGPALPGPTLPAWTWMLSRHLGFHPKPAIPGTHISPIHPAGPCLCRLRVGEAKRGPISALRAYPCPTGRTGGPWACVPTPGPPSPAPGAAAHQGVGRWRRFGDVSVAQVAEPRDEEARREQEGA